MIQRIQSIYLFLTTVVAVLFLSGTILKLSGGDTTFIRILFSGVYENKSGIFERIDSGFLLSVPVSLAGITALITVFLYKNRKLQLRLSMLSLVLSFLGLVSEVYYLYEMGTRFNMKPEIGVKVFLPLIMMIMLFLAFRGIKKDEELVKSYDRLR